MNANNIVNNNPVSAFLAVSIILIFSMYSTSVIKSVPCGRGIIEVFKSNFVHTNTGHMLSNIYALYALSRVERSIGSRKFFTLVLFILIVSVILESTLIKIFDLPCSIGFSGVLYGVTAWELVTSKKIDMYLIASIILSVIVPSLKNNNSSIVGHSVGALTGVIVGLLWNKLHPELSDTKDKDFKVI